MLTAVLTLNYVLKSFADVFNDVIEDVLARGVTGDEADGCRVRGAVLP